MGENDGHFNQVIYYLCRIFTLPVGLPLIYANDYSERMVLLTRHWHRSYVLSMINIDSDMSLKARRDSDGGESIETRESTTAD